MDFEARGRVLVIAGSFLFCQVVCDHSGAGLGKLLFRLIESVGEIAFDVEFTRKRFVHVNGNYDFRFHQSGAGKIARIFGDVVDHDGLTAAGSRAAESGVERNASVGRKAASEGSDDQIAGIRRIDQIKAYPVLTRHLFVKALGDTDHEELGIRSDEGIALKFAKKLGMRWVQIVAS